MNIKQDEPWVITREKIYQDTVNSDFVSLLELVPAEMYSKGVIEELSNTLGETDHCVVSHVEWAVQNGSKKAIVLSNDTDVILLLLFDAVFKS